MYEKLKKFIDNTSTEADSESLQIRLNTRYSPSKYFVPEDFNKEYLEYIKQKILSNDLLTDTNNQYQAVAATNCIYLDGDWHYALTVPEKDYLSHAYNLMRLYLSAWIQQLNNNNITNYYYFPFLPSITPGGKGGFHVMIFTDKSISADLRNQMYNEIKHYLLGLLANYNTILDVNVETEYEKLFDKSPLNVNGNVLLPFAQKDVQARRYMYVTCDLPNQFNVNSSYDYFVLGNKHRPVMNTNEPELHVHVPVPQNFDFTDNGESDFSSLIDFGVEVPTTKPTEEQPQKETKQKKQKQKKASSLMDDIKTANDLAGVSTDDPLTFRLNYDDAITDNDINTCINTNNLTEVDYTFIDSLLSDTQTSLEDGLQKLGITGSSIAEFMLSLEYLSPNHNFWRIMCNHQQRLIHVVLPLIRFVFVNHFIEKRGDKTITGDEFVHIITLILLPLLKQATIYYPAPGTKRDTYASCYQHTKNLYYKYSQVEKFTPTITSFWINYCKLPAKERKTLTSSDNFQLQNVKRLFGKFFRGWTIFITKLIMGGITDEIKPFRMKKSLEDNPRFNGKHPIEFDEVLNEAASSAKDLKLDDSFYVMTLRKWMVTFLVVAYYNNQSSTEAIRSVLTAFTRYFIWYDKTISGTCKIYIYNIRQTKQLRPYPYNQWLLDNTPNADFLKSWFKSVYLQLVQPELQTINSTIRIKPLLQNLEMTQLIADERGGLKPLANFDKDMESMYRNIIASFDQEYWKPPKELNPTQDPYFPMRNGILEFHNDGTYEIHYDNHERYLSVYTNVVFEDNYDYSSEEYKRVKKMFNEIFPLEEEREYVLKILSATLTGGILKDLLLIPYGSGGDGKTISNNAMLGMLGSDGLTNSEPTVMNGKSEVFRNPCGLGTTMKTEALLLSKKGGHDSGGIVMLKNKRFCTVQEPDPNVSGGKLNCSNIKEILSGTTITAREIFQKAESFTPNAVLTLQTNVLLAYSEDTDAIRRRVTVIPYRTKFTTAINEDKFKNLQYKFKADPKLGTELVNNPRYWQALFYVLLPYCIKLIKEERKCLSDIPRPASIDRYTNDSFSQSSGLVGWLNRYIRPSDSSAICVKKLIFDILDYEAKNKRDGGSLLSSHNSRRDMSNEIQSQLLGSYTGYIHRLRDENDEPGKPGFYNKSRRAILPTFNFDLSDCTCREDIINKYFNKFPITTMTAAYLSDLSDVYILGYQLLDWRQTSEDDSIPTGAIENINFPVEVSEVVKQDIVSEVPQTPQSNPSIQPVEVTRKRIIKRVHKD